MTYLEKAKELFPQFTEEELYIFGCPDMFGAEPESKCNSDNGFDCQTCWNREMSEVKAND